MPVLDHSAITLRSQLQAGEVSAVELAHACLARIESLDGRIGAFLRLHADAALEDARRIDDRRARGEPVGPLAGLPVAVKDNMCQRGRVTSCASRMLAEFRPPYDAAVIERLRAADAVIVGTTNMDEFAMGSSTEASAFQPTRNPWDLERTPGGSSGGAAACVAAGMVPLAVGSDTGGSIRQPAALCSVTGLKPTYGRVSRFGLVAFASSLDQIGPLARSAEDAALLLEMLAGHDERDSTSLDRPVPSYTASVQRPLENLRLGIVREHFAEGLDEEIAAAVRQAVSTYESLGARVVELSLPHSQYAVATYYVIAPSEASSNLARYDGVHYGYRTDEPAMLEELVRERREVATTSGAAALDEVDSPLVRMYRKSRAEAFGAEVKRRIMLGTYALSAGYYDAYYLKALKVRRLIRRDFDRAFEEVDLIAAPVTPRPAFTIGALADDPLAMYLVDLYTVSANLCGIPAVSIPCGFTQQRLPIGMQLLAPPLEEERLLRGAAMYQAATDWHRQAPDL